MPRFVIKKRTRITASLLASACFVALAVWGWGLPLSSVLMFTLILLGFLAVIITLAAAVAWLITHFRSVSGKGDRPFDEKEEA